MQRSHQRANHRQIHSFNPHPSRRTGATYCIDCSFTSPSVSILTRPGGRVQPVGKGDMLIWNAFQSSPVPEDGCNGSTNECVSLFELFQSSPVPEDGCNALHHARCPATRSCFNPHPSRRTGATHSRQMIGCGFEFQSSPVPEDGCNAVQPH